MNPKFLTNIFESLDTFSAHYKSGTMATNTKGIMGLLEFWLNKNGFFNLLSIPELMRLEYTITSGQPS